MSSFAEKISKLLDPVGESLDPEDDIFEETRAKLIDANELDEVNNDNKHKRGFRRTNTLDKLDEKYQGEVVSRKSLMSEYDIEKSNKSLLLNASESDEDSVVFSDEENDDSNEMNDGSDDQEYKSSDDDISLADSANEDGMDEEIDSDEAEGNSVEIFKAPVQVSQLQKKIATRNQLKLWELMLESRIKCQEMLTLSNKFPQHDTFGLFSDQVKGSLVATDEVLESLLLKLMELQGKLFSQNSTTKKIGSAGLGKRKGSSLEEIDTYCQEQSTSMSGVRNKILKLWFDKTRLATSDKSVSKSFQSFERTPVTQIADVLTDKDRLLKRTQSKRSQYRVLGAEINQTPKEESEETNAQTTSIEFDAEIFDDDDFYHQLLRHLIEQKSMASIGSSDSLELSRLNLKIQSLRSKARKNVDTKASKGRKIRYGIHSKLQSFMAPNDQSTVTHESRNEIFKSLFGILFDNLPGQ